MLNDENRERCSKVIKIYPRSHQMLLAMEELAELTQAISKYLRYGDTEPLMEEYADVEVMLEQIRQLLQIDDDEVNRRAGKKLWRALDGKVVI